MWRCMQHASAIFGSGRRALPHGSANVLRLYGQVHDRHVRMPANRTAHMSVQSAYGQNQLRPDLYIDELRNLPDVQYMRDKLRNLPDVPHLRHKLRDLQYALRNLCGEYMRHEVRAANLHRLHTCTYALPRTDLPDSVTLLPGRTQRAPQRAAQFSAGYSICQWATPCE